jgi:plastocyanin
MRYLNVMIISALAATLAACGGAGGTANSTSGTPTSPGMPSTPLGANDVTIQNIAFSPAALNISVGTTVTWHWNDCTDNSGYGSSGSSCVSHNVTFDDGSGIASSTQSTGTFSRAFTTAGTFKYHCSIHGAVMSGTVTVM